MKATGQPVTYSNIMQEFIDTPQAGRKDYNMQVGMRIYNLTSKRISIYTKGGEYWDSWSRCSPGTSNQNTSLGDFVS